MSVDYYNKHADVFFSSTITVDASSLYQKFLPLLKTGMHILDAGCGSGRDSKFFIEQGFKVTAFDASEVLAKAAQKYIGQAVEVATFQRYTTKQQFDAIWACASLLHVTAIELPEVFNRLSKRLTSQGVFYVSFKYGCDGVERDGRYFTNANEQRLASFIHGSDLAIKETWLTHDLRPGREDEQWLNAVLIKQVQKAG